MAGRTAKLDCAAEEIISYLPLSHVAAQVLDIFIPMLYAATVCFAQPDALKVRSLHSAVYSVAVHCYEVDQWRKRLEACIGAECGHFEHLL